MAYRSTKTYGHDLGLSACFRQWRAASHCRLLHGYALAFSFVFEAEELDHRNWVVDFGGLGALKEQLKDFFDHKLLVASDDPEIATLDSLSTAGLAEVVHVEVVGCEAFAKLGYLLAHIHLCKMKWQQRVRVVSCEVREHGANSAIYIGPPSLKQTIANIL